MVCNNSMEKSPIDKLPVSDYNQKSRMQYIRKINLLLSIILMIYATGNMTLFITPGVREFVQNYNWIVIFSILSPFLTRIFVHITRKTNLLFFFSFLAHLIAIFLSFTSVSLYFDTEIIYFTLFVIFFNSFITILYSFQNFTYFEDGKFLLLLTISSIFGSYLVMITFVAYNFPFFLTVSSAVLISSIINLNITKFMNFYNPSQWLFGFISVFVYKSFLTNYYEILGLKQNASPNAIREAFILKTKQLHPDKAREKKDIRVGWAKCSNTEQFMLVKEAYDVLKDEKKRKLYDEAVSSEGGFLMEARSKTKQMASSSLNAGRAEWCEDVIPGRRINKQTARAHFRNPEEEYNQEKNKNKKFLYLGILLITIVFINILYIRKLHKDKLLEYSK